MFDKSEHYTCTVSHMEPTNIYKTFVVHRLLSERAPQQDLDDHSAHPVLPSRPPHWMRAVCPPCIVEYGSPKVLMPSK